MFENPKVEMFDGLNMTELGVDEAYLVIKNKLNALWLYKRSSDCHGCAYSLFWKNGDEDTFKEDTKYRWYVSARSRDMGQTLREENKTNEVCSASYVMGEFGVYHLNIEGSHCTLDEMKEPVNIYSGLLACFLFLVVLAILWVIGNFIYKRCKKKDPEKEENIIRKRLKSLDVFRGISIVLMIFVNGGGGAYYFFGHATWDGLYVADLAFPWFIWIMGVCIPLAFRSLLKKEVSTCTLIGRIVRRSVILFGLGLMLTSVGGWEARHIVVYRLMNVLQRFGICYLIVALLYLLFSQQVTLTLDAQEQKPRILGDFIALWPQWVVMLLWEVGHLCLIFLVEVPGCPKGYLGPGGLADGGRYPDHCVGGVTGYLDTIILRPQHLYQRSGVRAVYGSAAFDPEGLIGCIPTVFQVFLGVHAGVIILYYEEWYERIRRFICWGFITGLLGAALCLFSLNGGPIPINKNLWSLSYVLVTTGMAYILLAVCYFLVDRKGWWNGAPFYYVGMNSIFLYVAHYIGFILFPWHWRFGLWNTHWIRLVECIWATALWVVVAFYMYTKNIFLKI